MGLRQQIFQPVSPAFGNAGGLPAQQGTQVAAVGQAPIIGAVVHGKRAAERLRNILVTLAGHDQDRAARRLDRHTLPRLPQRQARLVTPEKPSGGSGLISSNACAPTSAATAIASKPPRLTPTRTTEAESFALSGRHQLTTWAR